MFLTVLSQKNNERWSKLYSFLIYYATIDNSRSYYINKVFIIKRDFNHVLTNWAKCEVGFNSVKNRSTMLGKKFEMLSSVGSSLFNKNDRSSRPKVSKVHMKQIMRRFFFLHFFHPATLFNSRLRQRWFPANSLNF